MQAGLQVQPGLVVLVQVPEVGEVADCLLGFGLIRKRVRRPAVRPLANRSRRGELPLHHEHLDLVLIELRVRIALGRERVFRAADDLALGVNRQLLAQSDEERVGSAVTDFVLERGQAGRPDARLLVHVEAQLLCGRQQPVQVIEVRVHGVLRVHLHARRWEALVRSDHLGRFHVAANLGLLIGLENVFFEGQPAAYPLRNPGGGIGHSLRVVRPEPQPGVPAKRCGSRVVAAARGVRLDGIGAQTAIEVDVHAVDEAGLQVRGAQGADNHVAPVLALRPVDRVLLAVYG